MSVPAKPAIIVEPFGKNAAGIYINLPIPVPTQVAVASNIASFDDGFPLATFLTTEAGGKPPLGADFNGLLYMITAYLAYFQSGQVIQYDAAAQTAFGGYPVGAVLQKTGDQNAFWISQVANNMTDPDTGGAGWCSTVPLYKDDATLLGAVNNYALPGASDYTLDIDTTAGNVNITGFVPQRHNQTLYISNIGANPLTINALAGGSSAANQVRAVGDYVLSQYGTLAIRYSAGVSKWLIV